MYVLFELRDSEHAGFSIGVVWVYAFEYSVALSRKELPIDVRCCSVLACQLVFFVTLEACVVVGKRDCDIQDFQ